MKKLIACFLFSVPVFAMAGASSDSGNIQEQTGIVTPDIATGFRQYEFFTNTTDGYMVVCDEPSRSGKCDTGWKPVLSIVPTGRKFVGVKVVNAAGGYQRLQVWWK